MSAEIEHLRAEALEQARLLGMTDDTEKHETRDDVTVVSNYVMATERAVVMPVGASLNDEAVIRVGLEDEGAGVFVVVERDDQKFKFDPDEWPALREAIERMLLVARALG